MEDSAGFCRKDLISFVHEAKLLCAHDGDDHEP